MPLQSILQNKAALIFNVLVFAKSDCSYANTNYQSILLFPHKSCKGLIIFTNAFCFAGVFIALLLCGGMRIRRIETVYLQCLKEKAVIYFSWASNCFSKTPVDQNLEFFMIFFFKKPSS